MKNKIVVSILLLVLVFACSLVFIPKTYAFNEDLTTQRYSYDLITEKMYISETEFVPNTYNERSKMVVNNFSFTYSINYLRENMTLNGIFYQRGSIYLAIVRVDLQLEIQTPTGIAPLEYYTTTIDKVWAIPNIQDSSLNNMVLDGTNFIYTRLLYDDVREGFLELPNLSSYIPEVYLNVYQYQITKDNNVLNALGSNVVFTLYDGNVSQSVRIVERTTNNEYEPLLPTGVSYPVNTVLTFKDINYIYIDTLVKNTNLRIYLRDNPSGGGDGIEEMDFSSWIVNAVGGFLDFEVIPGLSLSSILMFIIAVGVLFLFIRFFAGG